jgi:hypothetical protein
MLHMGFEVLAQMCFLRTDFEYRVIINLKVFKRVVSVCHEFFSRNRLAKKARDGMGAGFELSLYYPIEADVNKDTGRGGYPRLKFLGKIPVLNTLQPESVTSGQNDGA